MRTVPWDARANLVVRITITLFNSVLRVTTASDDVTVGGFTWLADSAVNLTQILYTDEGTPAGADVRISPDSEIVTSGMARRGLLDGRPIKIEIFDAANPTLVKDFLPNSTIGSAAEDTNGVVVLQVQGPLALFSGPVAEIHSVTCKARFGDNRCHIPVNDVADIGRGVAFVTKATPALFIRTSDVWGRVFQGGSYNDIDYECTTAGTTHPTTQPTYPTVVGGTVTDGTAVFTARQAYRVRAVGQALNFFDIQLDATPDPEPSVLGNIIPQDGPLAGIRIPIRAFDDGTNIVTTFEPFAPSNFPTGTNFLVHRGCDKLFSTCQSLDNKDNFRGTPYATGSDFANARAS